MITWTSKPGGIQRRKVLLLIIVDPGQPVGPLKHYYVYVEEKYEYAELKDNAFVRCSGRKRFLIQPQPTMDDILIIKKNFANLKRNPEYKKRVT